MASPAQWTWVWVDSGNWWWTGRPGMLWFMRLQSFGHDWVTELNWSLLYATISWLHILEWSFLLHFQFSQFSHSVVSDSLRPHRLQHTRTPCPSPTPRVYSNSCPLSWWCHATISSSISLSPPSFNLSQHQGLFKWVSSLHQISKVLEFQFQHQSFQWIFRTDFL